jgi:hypothetical protein
VLHDLSDKTRQPGKLMDNTADKHELSPGPAATRLERWALFAEIAGAIAVVFSVIYLALQVSDNNRLLRSQAHYNALALGQRPLEIMLENEGLAGVLVRCGTDPETVDQISWERCSNFYLLKINSWEYFYYQHDDGSIPPQLWRGADAYYKNLLATNRGYARFWSELQIAFDEPFRSYVTAQFAAGQPKR